MQIEARLTFDKVQFDQDNTAHLVVSVTAPPIKVEEQRPSICIVPVIDVSPSMEGPKLEYAKRSLIKLIEHLSPNDYCGLVKFSGIAETVAKPRKVTAEVKDDLKRKIGELYLGNATNIAGALLEGLAVANRMDLSADVITRVILFTDGDANSGVATKPKDMLALVGPNIGVASISAFGYGEDVKQDFLSDLSKAGNGNYAFVKNPDDALSAFGKELGGLLSTYATNLVLEVSPLAGNEIDQVVSDVEADEEEIGQVTVKIPDVLSDETRNIVFAIKLKEQKNAFPREVNVFDVRVSYDILDANSRRERKTFESKAKVQFVKKDEAQAKPHSELDRIVALAQIVRAQIEAEVHAKRGDYGTAQGIMDSASVNFVSRGLSDLGVVAHGVRQRLANHSVYASSSSYLSSVTRGGTRGMGVSGYDAQAAADLHAAGVVMSNSTQALVAASFAGNDSADDESALVAGSSGQSQDSTGGLADRVSIGGDPVRIVGGGQTAAGNIAGIIQGPRNPLLTMPTTWGSSQVVPPAVPVVTHEPPKATKKAKRKIKQKSNRW